MTRDGDVMCVREREREREEREGEQVLLLPYHPLLVRAGLRYHYHYFTCISPMSSLYVSLCRIFRWFTLFQADTYN